MRQHITYKLADYENQQEMEQIYQLNYETFVEEIPQHSANPERKLVDRFHDRNTYVIAKAGDEVIGMVSAAQERPFSLDGKLDDLDAYLPEGEKPCEIRLLSVKESYRGGRVFYGLVEKLVAHCLEKGCTMALISGTVRQLKLYRHLGFVPFGPLVGTADAPYQPMYLTAENFKKASKLFLRLLERQEKREASFEHCFLPGPVSIPDAVRKAWQSSPQSHRAEPLREAVQEICSRLCSLTNARHAQVLAGTGTLANEAVAARLSTLSGKGLIVANGEFGERLICQGARWGLDFERIEKAWNTPVDIKEIETVLKSNSEVRWLWLVHCETSTGSVQPLEQLKAVCVRYGVKLCLDACSSVGSIPVDLSGVYLASAVSGKGLASYPGLAIVLHEDRLEPDSSIPAYLDLGLYQGAGSIPFTHNSNALFALLEALKGSWLADRVLAEKAAAMLEDAGMHVLRGSSHSPGILTIALDKGICSRSYGDRLKVLGIQTSYESGYLLARNWLQIALMGEQLEADVLKAVSMMVKEYAQIGAAV